MTLLQSAFNLQLILGSLGSHHTHRLAKDGGCQLELVNMISNWDNLHFV